MSQLRLIMLSESFAFKSFSFVISAAGGVTLAEYVGAARRSGGVAEVAIAHVQASSGSTWASLKATSVDCRSSSYMTNSDCPMYASLRGVPPTLLDGQCRIQQQSTAHANPFPTLGYPFVFSTTNRVVRPATYRCREGAALIDYTADYAKPGPMQPAEVVEIESALRAAAYLKLSETLSTLQ